MVVEGFLQNRSTVCSRVPKASTPGFCQRALKSSTVQEREAVEWSLEM